MSRVIKRKSLPSLQMQTKRRIKLLRIQPEITRKIRLRIHVFLLFVNPNICGILTIYKIENWENTEIMPFKLVKRKEQSFTFTMFPEL